MNELQKPFDNLKIRQAVAYAVNKQALIDTFYGGNEGAVPADNWMPPGTATSKPLNLPTYDPEKAKSLIAESGVTDLSFDFWYPSDVARPYMPDPEGRVPVDPQRPDRGRLQAQPPDRHLAAQLPVGRGGRQVPDVAHRLDLRLGRPRTTS